jgi:hypothetical protein
VPRAGDEPDVPALDLSGEGIGPDLLASRALPKFESYAASEIGAFFGPSPKPAIERFHGIGRLGVALNPVAPALDYLIDLSQRTILFWDVMRQRGNDYREHLAKTAPHVLRYRVELVMDGRTLERPVNYGLVRIVPVDGGYHIID